MERSTAASKSMAFEELESITQDDGLRLTRLPLGRSGRRLSFERRVRLWLYLLGLPVGVLLLRFSCTSMGWSGWRQGFVLLAVVLGWMFAVSVIDGADCATAADAGERRGSVARR